MDIKLVCYQIENPSQAATQARLEKSGCGVKHKLEEAGASCHPIVLYDYHYITNAFQGCSRREESLSVDSVICG